MSVTERERGEAEQTAAGVRAVAPGGWLGQLREGARPYWAVLRKDLLLEWRRKEFLGVVGLFTLLVLVVFTFALDLAAEYAPAVAPGALWIAYLFAGTLGIGRAYVLEREWGTLDSLLLAPVDRGVVYLSKVIGQAVPMLAVEVASLVVFSAFYNLPLLRVEMLPPLALGTLGLAAAATLFAGMAARTSAREVLLPVLLFPVSVPVLIAGVKSTAGVLSGGDSTPWLTLLVAFDLVLVVVGFLVFEFVLEE